MLEDRLVERGPLPRIGEREIKGRLRHADRLRGDADAAGLEARKRDLVARALVADAVLFRNLQIFEAERAGIRGALPKLVLDRVDLIAGSVGRREESGDAILAFSSNWVA